LGFSRSQMQFGAVVEVQSRSDPHTWLDGRFKDLAAPGRVGGAVVVTFEAEEESWDAEVEVSQVRLRPRSTPGCGESASGLPRGWAPSCGSRAIVEVCFPASKAQPRRWTVSELRLERGEFLFVSARGDAGRVQDAVVPRSRARAPSGEPSLAALGFLERQLVQVPWELADWAASKDATECLAQVFQTAGLLAARLIQRGGTVVADRKPILEMPPQVQMCGHTDAINLASLLLTEIHLPRHRQLQCTYERLMEKSFRKEQDNFVVEFDCDDKLTGYMIGKQGRGLDVVRQKLDVEIRISAVPEEQNRRRVTIRGVSQQAVEEAKRCLQIFKVKMQIKEDALGAISIRNRDLKEISKEAGLVHFQWDPRSRNLEILGTGDAVRVVRHLLHDHLVEDDRRAGASR